MGAGLSCVGTCARAECDGPEYVVDYIASSDRTLPLSEDGSVSEEADGSYFEVEDSVLAWDQAVGFAATPGLDPRQQPHPGMHPGMMGGHCQSFMQPATPTHPPGSWMPSPGMQGPGLPPQSGPSFAALQQPRMPQGGHVVPGPGWQHQQPPQGPQGPQGRNVSSYPGRPPAPAQQMPLTPTGHGRLLSHTAGPPRKGSVVSSVKPWEESSNQNPSPVPTQLLEDAWERGPQPVNSCHRLQSVPRMPAGLRTPVMSHRGPISALASALSSMALGEPGEPGEPRGFEVIATVADFELGFDLFGAKIRDAALGAGHTSDTMDNKFVSITDSYGRVFNWTRPLDFEPTVDMFPLMYRYTPPDEKSLGTGPTGTGPMRGSRGSRPSTASNLQNKGCKDTPSSTRRSVLGGAENYNAGQSTTLPMVMMGY